MAINEWKIWIKLGLAKPRPKEKINVEKDLKQIESFISEANSAVNNIQSLLKKFRQLRKNNLPKTASKKNLEAQIRTYDKILTEYQFFDLDEDISAIRIRKIAKSLKEDAENLKIDKKLLNKIKSDEKWSKDW